jgi:DNA-binding transcriptional LysR family regulator
MHEMEQMASALSDYAFGVKGHVRMGANTSAITQFLADDLAAFMRNHPAIRISLKEENSTRIISAVLNNQADLGIFADRTPCEGLTTYHYRYDELVLVAPRHHPLAARSQVSFFDTLAYDYIGLSEATSLAFRLKEESERLGRPLKLRIQVRGFDSICRMAVATQCIGILPRLAAATHARAMELTLIPLTDEWARRKLLIGVRDPATLTAAAKLLLAHVRQRQSSDA